MNTRKDNNGKALAAWKALGPAKVCHPLRYVRAKDSVVTINNKGVREVHYGPSAEFAEEMAKRGLGHMVNRMAMSFATS